MLRGVVHRAHLGMALVAGRKRVPRPATGKMALVILVVITCVLRALGLTLQKKGKGESEWARERQDCCHAVCTRARGTA